MASANSFIQNEDFIAFEAEPVQQRDRRGTKRPLEQELEEGECSSELEPEPELRKTSKIEDGSRPEARDKSLLAKLSGFLACMSTTAPWFRPRLQAGIKLRSPVGRLSAEIRDFVSYISPTEQEKRARAAAIRRIEAVVLKHWPEAQVRPFGSYYTELYLPTSDIDIVIVMPFASGASLLRSVAKALVKSNLVETGTIKIISKARIPLVKFTERSTNYTVDISFNQESGIEGSDQLRAYLDRWPAIRSLLLVLKQFLLNRSLNEVFSGGLGSYALTLLLVSFFQMHPMIQAGYIEPEENLGVLLVEFFELYGKSLFYDRVGISVLGSGSYYDKERDKDWKVPGKPYLLSIEDPHSPSNDVAKSSFNIGIVRQAFNHAFDLLSSLFIQWIDFEKQAESEALRSKGALSTIDLSSYSILSAILRVDEACLHHRLYIEHLGEHEL